MKPAVQFVKFITKRAFGIEIEVNKKISLNKIVDAIRKTDGDNECVGDNSYAHDEGNHYWHCKRDGSCGDHPHEGGWEIASYKASGAKDLMKVSSIGKVLQDIGAEVNDNCGFHVHAEIKDFTANQVATLVAYWMKIEFLGVGG